MRLRSSAYVKRKRIPKMSLWRNTHGRNDDGLLDCMPASTVGKRHDFFAPMHVGGASVADMSHSGSNGMVIRVSAPQPAVRKLYLPLISGRAARIGSTTPPTERVGTIGH